MIHKINKTFSLYTDKVAINSNNRLPRTFEFERFIHTFIPYKNIYYFINIITQFINFGFLNRNIYPKYCLPPFVHYIQYVLFDFLCMFDIITVVLLQYITYIIKEEML